VTGQVWQTGEPVSTEGGDTGVNFETGQGIPAWAIKIEGRLLEVREVFYVIRLSVFADIFSATQPTRER
jgi:hypothetical protein